VPAQPWAYEAGGSEEAGRVMEPRKRSSRGQQESRSGIAAHADGVHAPEGSSPGRAMARVQATTGVCWSGRQGLNRAGESPAIAIARCG
jgi:hypothetical protein